MILDMSTVRTTLDRVITTKTKRNMRVRLVRRI